MNKTNNNCCKKTRMNQRIPDATMDYGKRNDCQELGLDKLRDFTMSSFLLSLNHQLSAVSLILMRLIS